ncbi:NAD(P)-dependent oxidoreductase [Hyphomicrobium sp. CS1BSMeth3]|uniref:NAD(P)-dependent oxidoreductase n=1 Tax=Hyphomicrobium sp. CS1BSMeth3 TaxID=1892844 RepID=UPI0009304CA1|nr:NAD(P)-dependent oxidoreductase [Hyphomicrobium sp. CS1BSMeth3]
MKVGFIGLGTMGAYMAANLSKYLESSNHGLVVHDVRREAAEPFLAKGAAWAASPRAVAEACDVVFLSLPGPKEVEAVATGDGNGLLEGLKAGGAVFDLSTNAPSMVRKIAAQFAEKGCHFLDAPVSGGPSGARSGRLAIWVGGDKASFDEYKVLLDAFADQARYIGAIGAGSVAKLVHNCAGYAIQTALAEVFTMGVKGGVEPLALWEAVRTGAVGRSRAFDRLVDQFLPSKYEPPAFALKLALKDMTLATDLGRELGVPMRLSNLAYADMVEAMGRGWEAQDSRSAMKLQIERAGVEIAVDPERIKAALERDPSAAGDPKRS